MSVLYICATHWRSTVCLEINSAVALFDDVHGNFCNPASYHDRLSSRRFLSFLYFIQCGLHSKSGARIFAVYRALIRTQGHLDAFSKSSMPIALTSLPAKLTPPLPRAARGKDLLETQFQICLAHIYK